MSEFEQIKNIVEPIMLAQKAAYAAGFEVGKKVGEEKTKREWQEQIDWVLLCLEEGYINEDLGWEYLSHPQKCNDAMARADAMAENTEDEESGESFDEHLEGIKKE